MSRQFRIGNDGVINQPIDARGNLVFSAEDVERINREQNRRRITGPEKEAMMCIIAAGDLLRQCAVVLEDHARHAGKLKHLRSLATQSKTCVVALSMAVECRQLGSLTGQMRGSTITVSANPVPGMVNIPLEALLHICNRAMEQCGYLCPCTRDESKACELRRALELVPGVKESAKEAARRDPTRCPYRGMEMEVDG